MENVYIIDLIYATKKTINSCFFFISIGALVRRSRWCLLAPIVTHVVLLPQTMKSILLYEVSVYEPDGFYSTTMVVIGNRGVRSCDATLI